MFKEQASAKSRLSYPQPSTPARLLDIPGPIDPQGTVRVLSVSLARSWLITIELLLRGTLRPWQHTVPFALGPILVHLAMQKARQGNFIPRTNYAFLTDRLSRLPSDITPPPPRSRPKIAA